MRIIGVEDKKTGGVDAAWVNEDGTLIRICDLRAFWASPQEHLAAAPGEDQIDSSSVTLVPLVPAGAAVFCVGLNYRSHIAEGSFRDAELPESPTIFARWSRTLVVDGTPAPVSAYESGLDWEGEVAAFVGRTLVDVDADTAREAVVGYAPFNDLTSRIAQKMTSQWTLGKNGDSSGPLGAMTRSADVGDLRDGLQVQTIVNGEVMQDGNTRDMIFELGDVISLISRTVTLHPGDIICTGTPEGVGYARNPSVYLHPGDVVEVAIERLGRVTTPIAEAGSRA